MLPPWAFDDERGACTTVVLLAPAPTQFLLHLHPWPGQPSAYASAAGALQLTRCGPERAALMRVLVEMRSPRAVLHVLVAVGGEAPSPLPETLPERDTGSAAPRGNPGPPPSRPPVAERLASFEARAKSEGARSVRSLLLPRIDYAQVSLGPGCYRLLATGPDDSRPFALLMTEKVDERPESRSAGELLDVQHELCTARPQSLYLRVVAPGDELDRTLLLAELPLPEDLPARFGAELAARLAVALGGSEAPRRLGPIALATLGAQGRTPLPRRLLPHTCYVAAAVVAHGRVDQLSLGVGAAGRSHEATSQDAERGPRVAFCTGHRPEVDLDVEARGLGLAWLLVLFQAGPARPSTP